MRLNAYVLVADPAYLAASVQSYYPAVERIVVSYDQNHLSWSGEPIPVEECLAELRCIDTDQKLDLRPGRFSHPELPPKDCETRQRQEALEAASEGADWILQLDSDEVVPDLHALVDMIHRAEAASVAGLDFPSRWIYSGTSGRRVLEASSRFWRPAAGYPGPLAVRSDTTLRHARQCDGALFRADFRSRNTDPWRHRDTPVHATVPVNAGALHFSWVRRPDEMLMKAKVSGHRDGTDWIKEIAHWRFRQRHPALAVATTPLRCRGDLHPNWLRSVRLPVDPPARMVA